MRPPDSYLIINLAREIKPGDIAFTGVNSTAPMAACLLAKSSYDFDFTYINVAGGIDPDPEEIPLSSSDPELLAGSAAIFSNEDFYDLCTRGALDLVYLGAAQVDPEGRVNVSAIGSWDEPRVRLPGGGGAAVMMPTTRRCVIWQTTHSPRGLVERVDFATAAGAEAVVTPRAVFRRSPDGRFELESYHPALALAEVRALTGFEFEATDASPTPPPTEAELAALRAIGPRAPETARPENLDFNRPNEERERT